MMHHWRWAYAFLNADRVAAVHSPATLPSLHPDAGHVWLDLAIAVGAHPAAGTVPEPLRTIHRARHAGRGEDALPAHAAIEEQPLHPPLDEFDRRFGARIADKIPEWMQLEKEIGEERVDALQESRMAH